MYQYVRANIFFMYPSLVVVLLQKAIGFNWQTICELTTLYCDCVNIRQHVFKNTSKALMNMTLATFIHTQTWWPYDFGTNFFMASYIVVRVDTLLKSNIFLKRIQSLELCFKR